MEQAIRIGIIDDHDIVRKGLKELLENMGSFKVVEEHANGLAFINHFKENKHPAQLYLLDYSMPMMNGVEVLKEMTALQPEAKFVLLTQHLDDDLKIKAYENGARGFLNKTCNAQQLKQTIENVINLGYDNFEEILRLLRNKKSIKEIPEHTKASLTDRELQLLELVCDEQEFTYQEIADAMNLSIKSVDACRSQLFTKLDVKSKVGLVLYCYHNNVTKPFI